MRFTKFTQAALLSFWIGMAATPSASTQTFQVLYTFTGGADGAYPVSALVRDSAGNLYGTTAGTDVFGTLSGSVFKVSPTGKFKMLHNFGVGNAGPSESLVRDVAGNLYGTTYDGSLGAGAGNGTIYKLDKKGSFSQIYGFPGGTLGKSPFGLVLDPAGNLYGNAGGGQYLCDGADHFGCGLVFKLDPSGNETVLHSFKDGKKGSFPAGDLLIDAAGNLYGTTSGSFNPLSSLVFRLDPAGNETVLYRFDRRGQGNGPFPNGGLMQDAAGNLYGTTASGGLKAGFCREQENYCGLVFKLDTSGNETVLYYFTGAADGFSPNGGLVMDAAGNLYGTTALGGNFSICVGGCGVVFKLDPSGKETVLYSFTGRADGLEPRAGLTIDAAGNLYGTTYFGGNNNDCLGNYEIGCGVVFKITP